MSEQVMVAAPPLMFIDLVLGAIVSSSPCAVTALPRRQVAELNDSPATTWYRRISVNHSGSARIASRSAWRILEPRCSGRTR